MIKVGLSGLAFRATKQVLDVFLKHFDVEAVLRQCCVSRLNLRGGHLAFRNVLPNRTRRNALDGELIRCARTTDTYWGRNSELGEKNSELSETRPAPQFFASSP